MKLLALIITFLISNTVNASCLSKEYLAFDFWLGNWQVTTTSDNVVRHNKVTKINDGCTLLEEYSTPSGYLGKSLNIYNIINNFEYMFIFIILLFLIIFSIL